MEAGANLEARSRFGSTPLVTGAVGAALDALSALLRHGADVNAQQNCGETVVVRRSERNVCMYDQTGAELVEALLEVRCGRDYPQ